MFQCYVIRGKKNKLDKKIESTFLFPPKGWTIIYKNVFVRVFYFFKCT